MANKKIETNVNVNGNIEADAFIKSGGSSSEFLKADGTIDNNSYALDSVNINANNSLNGGGPLTGDVNIELDGDEDTPDINSYYGTNILGVKGFHKVPTQLIHNQGRFTCFTDNRWTTDSDDNYGLNQFQFNENCGTGIEPIIEWEHMGILLPENRIIKNLKFAGKSNNNQVSDLEIRVVYKYPNPITNWKTGMDNDNEQTIDTLFSGNYLDATMTGNMNDFMLKEIDLGDFETPEIGMLCIYLRPVGTITATRYYRATYTYEIE